MSVYAAATLISAEALANASTAHVAVMLLSVAVYVTVNQFLLGMALLLARGVSFRQSGILRHA